MNDSAIVLFSGGQDSTTCLAYAVKHHKSVLALAIDYGQRHRVELEQAEIIARKAGAHYHVLDMKFLSDFNPNALTEYSIDIEVKEGELPSTFVPGRNHLFLSMAATYAYSTPYRIIYTGVCQTDYSGYPDCRDEFIKSLNVSLNLAMDTSFDIRTPLMWMTKAETVKLMDELGCMEWYADSHTCYAGDRPACGKCPACELRWKGFKDAGFEDPLAYALRPDG